MFCHYCCVYCNLSWMVLLHKIKFIAFGRKQEQTWNFQNSKTKLMQIYNIPKHFKRWFWVPHFKTFEKKTLKKLTLWTCRANDASKSRGRWSGLILFLFLGTRTGRSFWMDTAMDTKGSWWRHFWWYRCWLSYHN